LKKQSQFVPGLSGATSYLKGIYDKTPPYGARKNKAKQIQFVSNGLEGKFEQSNLGK
jgi:hypothetical protein